MVYGKFFMEQTVIDLREIAVCAYHVVKLRVIHVLQNKGDKRCSIMSSW